MLPKKKRVSRSLFVEHLKKSRFFTFKYFTLRVSRDPSLKNSLFSFVVSTKVSKKAVERNRLRRRGYGIIRKFKNSLKPGFVCLFFYRKEALELNFVDLEEEILLVLKKAGVFNESNSN